VSENEVLWEMDDVTQARWILRNVQLYDLHSSPKIVRVIK
jgi:hypothetical protein